ncbi:MAG: shikimate kinase [bacterium]
MDGLSPSAAPTHIFLVGFSGSGKSCLAPLLAERLGCESHDTDTLVAERAGRSIGAIFAEQGQAEFRRLEREIIFELCSDARPMVVSLGGGAFVSAGNRRRIQAGGISIYLSCALRELYSRLSGRDDRPLLNVNTASSRSPQEALKNEIRRLYSARRNIYRLADLTVSTSARTPNQVAEEVIRRLRRRYGNHLP